MFVFAIKLDTIKLYTIKVCTIKLDTIALFAIKIDTIKLDTIKLYVNKLSVNSKAKIGKFEVLLDNCMFIGEITKGDTEDKQMKDFSMQLKEMEVLAWLQAERFWINDFIDTEVLD